MSSNLEDQLKNAEQKHLIKINHKHKIEKFITHLMKGGVIPEPNFINGDLGGQIEAIWKWNSQAYIKLLFNHRGEERVTFGAMGFLQYKNMPETISYVQANPVKTYKYEDVDLVKQIMQEIYAYVI